jgi:hypothetical protein
MLVTVLAAAAAGTVPRGGGGRLAREEDTLPRVTAAGDRAQRGGTVEAAIDLGSPAAAPTPFLVRLAGPAVGAQQGIAHGASWKTSPSVYR